jgi:DNA polymerase-3 subunit epsilon
MSVLEQPLVFVDIETNGLNHIRGRVVEVAAIRVEGGEVVREFVSFVNPGAPLPQFITNLTGITENDLADAPLFLGIADELQELLEGAIFVAHNVRFDYSFLKQEFKRIGRPFHPRQLCTMRLSRALYPMQRSHKLATLIATHGLQVNARHRAYDDAAALWQFLQKTHEEFPPEHLEQAIAKQLKQPSLPKALTPEHIAGLPEGPGVYIMYDAAGLPLYVGKSIHIRRRVGEHFMRDHDNVGEFMLSQNVARIEAIETDGELEALLLESRLVKELLPYQNKLLRRTDKLVVARKEPDDAGYLHVRVELAAPDALAEQDNVLAVYDRRSKLRANLEAAARDWSLCPALLGLEKTERACFWSQLGKCHGACTGRETPAAYNQRLLLAFSHQQLQPWPYSGPILLQELATQQASVRSGLIIDRWCVIGKLRQEEDCEPVVEQHATGFDLDTYNILKSYLATKLQQLSVQILSRQQAENLGLA